MPLPAGTLTLIFTDIERSTRLLQELGEEYAPVLVAHQRLIRAALARFGGHEVDTAGDGFFLVFERARDAVAFAVAAQQAIRRYAWPTGAPVRVRIGMHTGEPVQSDGHYVGLDVHRAARISSAGYGDQILLSSATRALLETDPPPGVTLRDLGMHRLKDLQQWEHLYQVVSADLPVEFPPLQSLDTLPNNLPRKLTSFVGREREIADVKGLVGAHPLVTIVGIGGSGKTRLALQVAADLLAGYTHGAWLVELAPVTDSKQVPEAVAAALGVREYPGFSLRASLLDHLSTRQLLLVLDNCEHLVVAVAEFVETVVAAAPDARILCTSRESLGIAGERVWRIPSLALPSVGPEAAAPGLVQNEAVLLFAERARTASPAFRLSAENLPAVARVCVRLDGIPLAIELAAARVKVLSVDQVAARLDDRFRLLTGGSRTALARQQTLQATMDWSFDLLTDQERALLRRLSVFAGGWTLDAAEAVCADETVAREAVLDLLTRLVDKSLVEVDGGTVPRYRMLETVRQYGQEKLLAAEAAPHVRSRHRDWFQVLAADAAGHLRGPEQKVWLERLERERDNLHTALGWSAEDDPDRALRMAADLWRFWYLRGRLSTGGEWLEEVLQKAPTPTAARAKALNGAAVLAYAAGNYDRAVSLAHQAVALARTFDDRQGFASGVLVLGTAHLAQGEFARAAALVDESLTAFRDAGDVWGQALALSVLGDLALNRGEYDRAVQVYEESVALFRQVGDAWGIALSQRGSGFAARLQGDYDLAVSLQAASLALARELGDRTGISYSLVQLGFLQWRQGEYARAAAALQESLALFRDAGNRRGVADALSVLGLVEEYQGDHQRAAEVLQESVELYRAIGSRAGVASVTGTLGRVALHEGDVRRAVDLAEESVTLFRELGDRRGTATSLRLLGEGLLHRGELDRAWTCAGESRVLFQDLGDRWAIGYALRLLAAIALLREEYGDAHRWYAESLALHREHGDRLGIVKCLEGLMRLMAATNQPERGARLLGAADRLRGEIGAPRTNVEAPVVEQGIVQLRAALRDRFEVLMDEGRGMTDEQIMDLWSV